MMLYTKLLVDKFFLYKNYKGFKLKRKIKEYKENINTILKKALDNNEFIIKFDELYELYILIENYVDDSGNINIIKNEDPDILSFYYKIDNIIEYRVDLDPSARNFRIYCKEMQIDYSIDYLFHISIKYTDYIDDSKEKDKQLMQYLNCLLYKIYFKYLNIAIDSNTAIKDKTGSDVLNESYNSKEDFDYKRL